MASVQQLDMGPRQQTLCFWLSECTDLIELPGLQPRWTRKDRQHFPILNINEKLSMLYIPEVLRHYAECQDFSLGEPERIDNIFLY